MVLLQDVAANPETVTESFELFNKLSPKFFLRMSINLVSVAILIRFIYYPKYKNREFFFTYFAFNLIIFLITYLMNKVEMSMGAAFGLFAVFSILRYRTEDISIRDMTYLFLVIAMGLITAVSKGGWDELSLLSLIILAGTWLVESNIIMRNEYSKVIYYENVELIKPENEARLMEDLKLRTGLNVRGVQIIRVDYLRDMAIMKIHYTYAKKK